MNAGKYLHEWIPKYQENDTLCQRYDATIYGIFSVIFVKKFGYVCRNFIYLVTDLLLYRTNFGKIYKAIKYSLIDDVSNS